MPSKQLNTLGNLAKNFPGRNMGTFDGVNDYILLPALGAGDAVVSSGGTAVPLIYPGVGIGFSAGNCWDLLLSNGLHFPLSEGSGNYIHATDGTPAVLVTDNVESFWAGAQSVYLYNYFHGYGLRQNYARPSDDSALWALNNATGSATLVNNTAHLETVGANVDTVYFNGISTVAGKKMVLSVDLLTSGNNSALNLQFFDGVSAFFRMINAATHKRWQFVVVPTNTTNNAMFIVSSIPDADYAVDIRIHDVSASDFPVASNIPAGSVVVCFGDSITEGPYIDYPEYLGQILGCTSINSGHSGYRFQDLIPLWSADVAAYAPDYVVIECGANDILNSVLIDDMQSGLDTLIANTLAIGAIPIICDILPAGLHPFWTPEMETKRGLWNTYINTLPHLIVNSSALFADNVTPTNMLARLTGDGIHPNSFFSGKMIADNIAETVFAVSYPEYIETIGLYPYTGIEKLPQFAEHIR